MADEANEVKPDTQIGEEVQEQSVEQPEDNIPTVDDYNKLKAEKDELESKNKQLYERVKKAEPLKKAEPSNDKLEEIELKMELRDRGIPLDAMPFIKKNGGLKGLEDPIVKAAVESIKTQKAAEQATQINSSGQSDIEKKYSTQELRNMKTEDLEKLLPRA